MANTQSSHPYTRELSNAVGKLGSLASFFTQEWLLNPYCLGVHHPYLLADPQEDKPGHGYLTLAVSGA